MGCWWRCSWMRGAGCNVPPWRSAVSGPVAASRQTLTPARPRRSAPTTMSTRRSPLVGSGPVHGDATAAHPSKQLGHGQATTLGPDRRLGARALRSLSYVAAEQPSERHALHRPARPRSPAWRIGRTTHGWFVKVRGPGRRYTGSGQFALDGQHFVLARPLDPGSPSSLRPGRGERHPQGRKAASSSTSTVPAPARYLTCLPLCRCTPEPKEFVYGACC
jgi:hypothetical protein